MFDIVIIPGFVDWDGGSWGWICIRIRNFFAIHQSAVVGLLYTPLNSIELF